MESTKHSVTSGHIEAIEFAGHDLIVHYKKGKPYTHICSREEFNEILRRHAAGESIGKMVAQVQGFPYSRHRKPKAGLSRK